MDLAKEWLKNLLMLWLNLAVLAVSVNSDPDHHRASGDLNETIVLTADKEGDSSSHGDVFSNGTTLTDIGFSTHKPLINQPREFVSTFISTIRDYHKNMTKDFSASSEEDNLRNSSGTLPNITSKPKTTSENISGGDFVSSESVVHNSFINLISNDSNTTLVTPVHGDISIIARLENNSNFNGFFNHSEVNDFKDQSVLENGTFPTEIQEYDSEPIIGVPNDDSFAELNKSYSQFGAIRKKLINSSSEMTTSLDGLPFSDNFEMTKNGRTVKSFESTEDIEAIKIKELPLTTLKDQNQENLDLFHSKRQDKSAFIDNPQKGANYLPISVTISALPSSTIDTVTNVTVSKFSYFNDDINNSTSEYAISMNTDFKLNVGTETITTTLVNHQNSSEQVNSDVTIIKNETVLKVDAEYMVMLPKICSNHSTINRLLHLLTTSPNSKKTSNLTCDTLKDMEVVVKSKPLFDKINEFLITEAKADDVVYIKVSPNSKIAFEIFSQSSFDGIFISKMTLIIFVNVMSIIVISIICLVLYKKKYHKRSTSLDLCQIPHLNLKADYCLTPIPRPSIAIPDGKRDFLHAYAQDNYNRSRQNNNTLNKRNSTGNMPTTYEEAEREIGSKQEMKTFTTSSGRKSEFRGSSSQDYVSSNSWDRLHERKYPIKYGVDNPAHKNW